MYLPIHAQNNSTSKTKYLAILQDRLKQIKNRTIHYNYYLGEDLYTERSYINEARVSMNSNNKIELYINLTTQKYDVNASAMVRSEHGESIEFDPASINEIKIKGKLSDYSKSELGLLVIDFTKEVEKRNYFQRSKNEDPTLLDTPSVYEFELPYYKKDMTNPEAIKNALLDLKSLSK
jgi:hypothetical protein